MTQVEFIVSVGYKQSYFLNEERVDRKSPLAISGTHIILNFK